MEERRSKKRRSVISVHLPTKTFSGGTQNKRIGGFAKGRLFTSKEYKDALWALGFELRNKFREVPYKWCDIEISFGRGKETTEVQFRITTCQEASEKRMDVDAPLKFLQDALQEAGVIEDDRYIRSVKITKE